MEQYIVVQIKSVYGKETVYPVCQKATLFAKLAQTKTLTSDTLAYIRALGYRIEVKQQEISL